MTRATITVAVYGGSFHPWHEGHQMIVDTIAKRLRVQQVWLLVTAANPLKENVGLSLVQRVQALQAKRWRYGVRVLAVEKAFNTPFIQPTMRVLQKRAPRVKFIWVMGSDGLYFLSRWHAWREFIKQNRLVIFSRPRYTNFNKTMFYYAYKQHILSERKTRILHRYSSPAWLFMRSKLCSVSSTQLRQQHMR
jgi:nicotinate-nucleotide adenylyltransferase